MNCSEKRECSLCKVRPSFDKIRDVCRPWHPFWVEGAAISGFYRKILYPPLLDLWIGSWDLQRQKDFIHLKSPCLGSHFEIQFYVRCQSPYFKRHLIQEAWYQISKLDLVRLSKKLSGLYRKRSHNLFTSKHIYVRQEAWYYSTGNVNLLHLSKKVKAKL